MTMSPADTHEAFFVSRVDGERVSTRVALTVELVGPRRVVVRPQDHRPHADIAWNRREAGQRDVSGNFHDTTMISHSMHNTS